MVIIMKKLIPVLGVLAGAAALVAYKMKKDEQKQIIDLDQGLLHDDDEEMIQEEPISNPASCCEEFAQKAEDMAEDAADKVKNLKERTEELLEDVEDKTEDVKQAFQIHIEDAADAVEEKVEEATEALEEEKDSTYPHLSCKRVEEIIAAANQQMEELQAQGDVHKHERPVQHRVKFDDEEALDGFKNTVINKGFVITNGEEDHELVVLHITAINNEKLYDNMLYLADTAAQYHGTYEGWTTKVVY